MNAVAMGTIHRRPLSLLLLRCVNVNAARGTFLSHLPPLPHGRNFTHRLVTTDAADATDASNVTRQCTRRAAQQHRCYTCTSTNRTSSVNSQPRDTTATNIAQTNSNSSNSPKSPPTTSGSSSDSPDLPDDDKPQQSPSGLTTDGVMNGSANRATRFVFLRTLPLKKHHTLATEAETLAATIESNTRILCQTHLDKVCDDRAAVHLHTAALAIATFRTLAPFVRNDVKVHNIIRAGFGAPLLEEPTMTDDDLLTLNDDQTLRPDYWIVRFALWFAFDKMAAVRKMTANMVNDFGKSFETQAVDDDPGGLPRHVLRVKKCFYHTLCREEGLPQLTKIFCALDRNIYAPINTSRHHVRFTLDKTIADAEDDSSASCEFKFVKIK